jgi:hypothetical protein
VQGRAGQGRLGDVHGRVQGRQEEMQGARDGRAGQGSEGHGMAGGWAGIRAGQGRLGQGAWAG